MMKTMAQPRRTAFARTGRALAITALAGLLGACAQQPKSLYTWEGYQPTVYAYLKEDGNDYAVQAQTLEKSVEKARATNRELPPGFRAHLGMLYLKMGDGEGRRAAAGRKAGLSRIHAVHGLPDAQRGQVRRRAASAGRNACRRIRRQERAGRQVRTRRPDRAGRAEEEGELIMMKSLRLAMLAIVALLAGCAGPQRNVDYTAFRESKPASILVLPPLNTSVDVAASAAVLSQATLPLAESGYYVVPVAVMEETFRQNGLTTPDDIHAVPAARLREIFGADAALYMTVKEYGASYKVVSSDVTVSIDATLLDLRSGAKLWTATRP